MIVLDNFVKDGELLNEIRNDSTFFDTKGYHWWNGWWDSPANSTKRRLIEYIWRYNYPSDHQYELYGFEYWTGVYSADNVDDNPDTLNMHFDKDEQWYHKTGELRTPIIGTVYYPWEHDIDGGYLEVFSNGEDQPPERIAAVPNRLVIFGAGQYPHRVTKVTRGTRYAIAINLWQSRHSGLDSGELILE